MNFSTRPAKQLLWFWLSKDMKKSQNFERGIDAGCHEFANRQLFQTEEYIGINVDQQQLQAGKNKYPEAKTINKRIEEVENVKGDFVICTQVVGSTQFNSESLLEVIKSLVEMTEASGTLIFNLHGEKAPRKEEQVDLILEDNFSSIQKKYYGRFNNSLFKSNKPRIKFYLSVVYSLTIAFVLYLLPPLRERMTNSFIYYVCENKLC